MIPMYLVDAFADGPFTGNPAGVMVLGERDGKVMAQAGDDAFMAHVAMEMKQSETAFVWPMADGRWGLRWWTPGRVEVDLCGHATLAAGHVLWETGRAGRDEPTVFETRSGILTARRGEDGLITLDFPADEPKAVEGVAIIGEAIGEWPRSTWRGRTDYMVELGDAEAVRSVEPEMALLRQVDARGLIVTAKSDDARFDFVCRFFGPAVGIDEDPVTGSAHCTLAPMWSRRLGRSRLVSFQASSRGGVVTMDVRGDRIDLGGRARTVLVGQWQV